ncbi:ABC transporter permease [Heyndrickxia acidiproducens]|uniref:ABC transporter permease n=1 Tax=Heyndrickxia acidiproducens TaxID=1121084 RepID=UPI000363C8F4|nr:ABC transporter permease [Heyndrickxia acidiproducens]
MNRNELIFRSLKKNMKHYAIYIFALVFSAALYFAFVTLQYDPAMNDAKGSVKGAAALRSASVLLIAIIAIFLLYANNLFIKRRGKEIGLFQLVGMTKRQIFWLLSAENWILYYGSLVLGVFFGFSVSKLMMMILFKILNVNVKAALHFSPEAFIQTILVFTAIYLLILATSYIFIKRQSILTLFTASSSAEDRVKKMSAIEIILGIVGFIFIVAGYFISSKLFDGDFTTITQLFTAMISILALVIIGTYLFYKTSIRYLFHMIRKKKDGYMNINEVMSLSSIMFRMKSNALLLTIITTISALAIGLLSLSYITYYSAEKTARNMAAADFSFTNQKDAVQYLNDLAAHGIHFDTKKTEVIRVKADLENILDGFTGEGANFNPAATNISVVSERSVENVNVRKGEAIFFGYSDALAKIMPFKKSGPIQFKGAHHTVSLQYIGLKKDRLLSNYFTDGGMPVAVVDNAVYDALKADKNKKIQKESPLFFAVHLENKDDLKKADQLFNARHYNKKDFYYSCYAIMQQQKENMGLIMFIVGFLGLAFLITSGCILYFKQMEESEEEKPSYTILRKLGFTDYDLIKGIRFKQLFNFGIPLILGLLHSYFAVQSGWFLFGTELWTPMLVVMILYTALYSIFAFLSVEGYKKVIREAL